MRSYQELSELLVDAAAQMDEAKQLLRDATYSLTVIQIEIDRRAREENNEVPKEDAHPPIPGIDRIPEVVGADAAGDGGVEINPERKGEQSE